MWSKIQLLNPRFFIDKLITTQQLRVIKFSSIFVQWIRNPHPTQKIQKTILFWFIILIISPLQSKHTPGVMYYICSGCMLISAVFSLLLPETKGRALENMIAKKTGSKIDNEGKNNDQSKKYEVYDLEKY